MENEQFLEDFKIIENQFMELDENEADNLCGLFQDWIKNGGKTSDVSTLQGLDHSKQINNNYETLKNFSLTIPKKSNDNLMEFVGVWAMHKQMNTDWEAGRMNDLENMMNSKARPNSQLMGIQADSDSDD